MADMIVRKAEEKDIPSLIELVKGYLEFYKRPIPEDQNIADFILHFIKHPEEGCQFVAEEEGRLVGFTTLVAIWSTTRLGKVGLLNDLFVNPSDRKKGIAEKLMYRTMEEGKERGYPLLRLLTAHDNIPAQSLYEKTGWNAPGWKVYDYDSSQ